MFQLTKNSTIELSHIQDISPEPSYPKLVTYRGIVTHSHTSSGFYILDKTVHLSTSLLCAVTNMPCIPLATTVTVHNAHLAKFRGHKWLVLCGAGFVQLHQEIEDLRVHPSEEEMGRNMTNPVINIVQEVGESWTCQEMLLMLENYKMVEKCFPENILLDKLLRVSLEREVRSSRSLTKEFLNHQEFCSLEVPPNHISGVRTILSLEQLRDIIDNNFSDIGGSEHQVDEREIEFEDRPLIIGIFGLDQNGRTVLTDENSAIIMVGKFESVELGHYIEIQRLTVTLELVNIPCIVVHKFRTLGSFHKIPSTVDSTMTKSAKSDVKTCQVIAKSAVMKDSTGQYFLVICNEMEEGKIILRIESLAKYFLIKQTQKLIFSNTKSCFKKIEFVSSEEFEAKKLFDQVPWFQLKEDTNINISEVDENVSASVYTLENAEDIPSEELINIVAVVVSKLTEDEDNKSKTNNILDKVCKMQLVLSSQLGHENTQYTFYLSTPFILGLVPGSMVEVTSAIKTISKKGLTYFRSTHFTTIGFIASMEHSDETYNSFSLTSLQHPGSSSMVELLVSLEKVVSLVVMVECGGCNSSIANGRCSYVGCNVAQNYEFTFKATFEVLSVDTFATVVSLAEEDIKTILNCSEDDWEKVKAEATISGRSSMKCSQLLCQVAAAGLATADSCCLRARRFTGQETARLVKMFCLKAWRLQTRQLNCLYEQLLD